MLRIFLVFVGVAVFLVFACFGYYLLLLGKLSGAEFSSFVIAFAVIGLIISFSSEVQEFSIAGNIVKLKEVKKDAEKSISELKIARTETFRLLLSFAKRFPGGWGSSSTPIDSRVEDFWFIHKQIVEFKSEEELKSSISEAIEIIIKGQLSSITNFNDDIAEKYRGKNLLPTPNSLTIEALDCASVQKTVSRMGGNVTSEIVKEKLMLGIQEYIKLYELRESLKSM